MAERFNASLNEATQEHMDALCRTIQETVEWQKATRDELKALVGELISGAEEQRKNLAVSLEQVERIQAQVPVCERLQGLLGRLSEDMAHGSRHVQCRSNVMELHRSTEEMAKMHGELEEHLSELVGRYRQRPDARDHQFFLGACQQVAKPGARLCWVAGGPCRSCGGCYKFGSILVGCPD